MTDQEVATRVYLEAMEVAKAEFKELHPKFREMQLRIVQLKRLIQATSYLTGNDVEDEYMFVPTSFEHGKPGHPRYRGKK